MSNILLVEDEDLFAEMVRKALVTDGHTVVRARNGAEALHLYDPQTVSLVLTDLLMPDVDGMELIVKLQQRDPAVRIIAMTGGGRCGADTYLPIAERLGAVKTLAKPFSIAVLASVIKECLDET